MPDLLSLLSLGASGLGAARAAAATASQNLANANTPGYSRQRANLEAVLPAERVMGTYIGRGVTLGSVTQVRDRFLEAQLPAALAGAASSSAEASVLTSIATLDPANTSGLTPALSSFYSSLRALAQNPSDPSLRQAVVSSSQQLARTFNATSADLSSARAGADSSLQSELPNANTLAAQLADLNARVRTARAAGGEPNDLLDARQKAQDALVSLTGATIVTDQEGNANAQLPGGEFLVFAESAGTLSALPDPTNGGLVALQLTRTDGSGPVTLTSQPGGKLGGLIAGRDGALKTAQTQLDQLAFDLGSALNAVHQGGFALDGSTGRDLFTLGATSSGAAATISVNASVAANPSLLAAASTAAAVPGDATALNALVATETQTLSGGLTAESTLASLVSQYGSASGAAQAYSDHDGGVLQNLQTLRESTSGVSVDEELVELTKAQRGFEALSKVITTTDQMLQTLLALKS